MLRSEICCFFMFIFISNIYFSFYSYFSFISTVVYFGLSSVHSIDIFSYNFIELVIVVFLSHFVHLAVILSWLSCIVFHIGWSGNFIIWFFNPILFLSIAHYLFDLHIGFFGVTSSFGLIIIAYSGCYYWFLVSGIITSIELFYVSLVLQLLALFVLLFTRFGTITIGLFAYSLIYNTYSKLLSGSITIFIYSLVLNDIYVLILSVLFITRLKLFHSSFIFNFVVFCSIFWCAHLIIISTFIFKFIDHNFIYLILIIYFVLFSFIFFYMNEFLSFGCGLISGTLCLFIFDVLHHHLALGFLIIFLTTILNQFKNCVLYRLLNYVQRFTFTYSVIDSGIESYYSKLSLVLSVFGSLTSLLAQHIYSLCSYSLLFLDFISILALYTNHQYISALLLTGSLVHAGLIFLRDFVI